MMRMLKGAAGLLLFLFLTPSMALAQSAALCAPDAGKGGILTGLVSQFSTTTTSWTTSALAYAQDVFFALVAIEIAWSGITYVLQKDSLPDFVAALLLKILSVGFFYILLQPQYGPVWISDIVASFSQAGSAIGGQTSFLPSDPSAVFNCGTDIANAMLQSLTQNNVGLNLGNILPAIEAVLAALICAFGMVIAFAIVAGQLLITLIESYIVVGAGVFMLGFTGSRWTLVFGEKYVGYAFSVGIKLFMLELIVGLGFSLGQQWAALFGNGIAPPEVYLEVVGAALIFGFVAWQIPGLAGSLMNGSPRMTLGSFLNTAGTVAVGGAVVSSAIGGMTSGSAASRSSLASVRAASEAAQSGNTGTFDSAAAASRRWDGRFGGDFAHDGSLEYASTGAHRFDDSFAAESEVSNAQSSSGGDGSSAQSDAPDAGDASVPSGTSRDEARRAEPGHSSSNESSSDFEDVTDQGAASGAQRVADANDAAVTADEATQTRASDDALSHEDGRIAQRADQGDTRQPPDAAAPSSALRSPPPPFPTTPPAPDDSADGSIHIRFKHPE